MPELLRQISITVKPEAEEEVAALLHEEFGQSASSHTDLATGLCTVSVYWGLPAGEVTATRGLLREGLRDLAAGGLDVSPGRIGIRKVPARDWSESWKRHFRPIEIGRTLLVQPTWSRRKPKAGQQLVLLDPGLSFGTGQHATTRYCLEQVAALRRPGTEQSLLDAGCGSGILAIAAARLGYAEVSAFDYDAEAVRIAVANCELNRVSDGVTPTVADLTRLPRTSREKFDVICANLISDLLIAERSRLLVRLKPGGALVVAGILATQFREVERALTLSGLRRRGAKTEGEWRSGWFQVA
ncbi:MAG: hypothetical protein RIS76_864 [Verrucomicrobiota bacterium]